MISTFCLLSLGMVLVAIGMVLGLRLGAMKRDVRERLDERHAERKRIARELHDTVLQSIQALMYRLQLWTDDNRIPAERRAEVAAVLMQTRTLVVECRDRLISLRRNEGERVDLLVALGSDCCAASNADAVSYKATFRGERRCLRREAYDQLLEIGREAIRNAHRHSRARTVVVTLEYARRSLRMQIADDGCGIDPSILQCPPRAGHFGLMGMRERAAELGTRLLIETNGAVGTRITLTVAGRVAFLTGGRWAWRPRRRELWTVDEAAL
jgi:signal transduction histidine kinase